MTGYYSTEALNIEFDMGINSEAFGSNQTFSVESSIYEYHNKYYNYERNHGKVKIDFQSQFSYDSAHNDATTFEHTKNFIKWMYCNNLFINDCMLYDTTYGFIKQYRCENTMWLLSVFTVNDVIDDKNVVTKIMS